MHINTKNKNIPLLYVSSFIGGLQFFTGFLSFFYKNEAGFSYTKIFLLTALLEILVFILEIPTGILADRFGKKKSLVIGHTLSAASLFMIAVSPKSYSLHIIWVIISSICITFNSGTIDAFLYDTLKDLGKEDSYLKFKSKIQALFIFSGAISMTFGGWISESSGVSKVFLIAGICGFIQVALLSMTNDSTKVVVKKDDRKGFRNKVKELINIIGSDSRLVRLIIPWTVFIALASFFGQIAQLIMTEAGATSSFTVSVISAGIALVSSLSFAISSRVIAFFSRSTALKISAAGVVVSIFITCITMSSFYVIIPMIAFIFFSTIASLLINDETNKLIQSKDRATILSIQNQFYSLFLSVFSITIGLFIDMTSLKIGVFAIFILLSVISIYLFKEKSHETSKEIIYGKL